MYERDVWEKSVERCIREVYERDVLVKCIRDMY